MSRAKFRKERRRGAEREIREWGHWTARIEGFMSCRSVCMSSTFDYIHYNTSSVFIERAACTISISTCLTTAQSSREWKRERYRCAPIHSFTFSDVKLVYTHSHIIICPRSCPHPSCASTTHSTHTLYITIDVRIGATASNTDLLQIWDARANSSALTVLFGGIAVVQNAKAIKYTRRA